MSVRYGVSPAFFISQWGTQFSPADICASLPVIRELGFTDFQPEIYTAESLEDWRGGGAAEVVRTAAEQGIRATVFVAHFLMEHFASAAALASEADLPLLDRALDIAGAFPDGRVFSVPMAPFQLGAATGSNDVEALLEAKVRMYLDRVTRAGFSLSFELLPGNVLGSFDGFLRLASAIGSPRFGVLLDTGHAWAMREAVELLPLRLAGRVFGVHLKDNDGTANLLLVPGAGRLNWQLLLNNLLASGYAGSLDLEIGCPPGRVRTEYAGGLHFLKSLHQHSISAHGHAQTVTHHLVRQPHDGPVSHL